jgi:hypothetical protein
MVCGFQAADAHTRGELLRSALQKDPDDVYAGLLNVLMRLVFLLFAEDRGIVPTNSKTKRATGLYVRHYSVHGLFERHRTDAQSTTPTPWTSGTGLGRNCSPFFASSMTAANTPGCMDCAVLEAYGWPDLIPHHCQCEFLLDYEDEEATAEETGRRRKKPWRYRWPHPVRDEVLARLLKLNAQRAEEELLSGTAATIKKTEQPARQNPLRRPTPGGNQPRPANRLVQVRQKQANFSRP